MIRFAVGFPLIMHGLAHLGGFLASWLADRAGFEDRPWLLSQQVRLQTTVGRVLSSFWLMAAIGLASAGLGAILQQAWWPDLAVVGAVISLATILLWWKTVPMGAKLGAAFDVVIITVMILPLFLPVVYR